MRRNFIKTYYSYPLNVFIATFGSNGIHTIYGTDELPDHFVNSMIYAIDHISDTRGRDILKMYYRDQKLVFEICDKYDISRSRVTQYLDKAERLLRRMRFLITYGNDAFIENEKSKDVNESVNMDIYDEDDIRSLKSKLSTKAWRCCTFYADYKSISDLRESFKNGRIMYIRGLGAKTALEIAKAIGYDMESDKKYAEILERYYRSIGYESDFKRSFIIRMKTFSKFIESSKIDDKDKEFAKEELIKLAEKIIEKGE